MSVLQNTLFAPENPDTVQNELQQKALNTPVLSTLHLATLAVHYSSFLCHASFLRMH